MKQAMLTAMLAAATPMAVAADAGPAAASGDTSWIRQNDGEALLRYFLLDGVGLELQSAQIALGVERTCALVRPPFETAVQSLKPGWSKLFQAMDAKFPYEPRHKGRDAQLLLAVGLESLDLLQPKLDEISKALKDEHIEVSPDAIDYESRFKEIERARADGRASCGLRGLSAPAATSAQQAPE